MYRLRGRIQPYAWGGNHFIPDLFNLKSNGSEPAAEYWLGAHPGGVTEVELTVGQWIPLADTIASAKEQWLGIRVAQTFGRLPYLLKVLDVKDMLSIQVHPTKKAAEIGYARENENGIPLDAPHRNYKDDNHKPEVMIALNEFWLLHGFAPDIRERIGTYSFFHPFIQHYENGGIKGLYTALMELDQLEVNAALAPLADTIVPLYEKGNLHKISPDFWAARAIKNLCKDGNYDRGIFSIYLFNLLRLDPGDGIFQGAGMPHAYLEGQNIELMSNSDNVLRAGLTPKYIDIHELLENTLFDITTPRIIKAQQNQEQSFDCPVPDFKISSFNMKSGQTKNIAASGPSIILFVRGEAFLKSTTSHHLQSAAAYYLKPGDSCNIEAQTDLYFFIAHVE